VQLKSEEVLVRISSRPARATPAGWVLFLLTATMGINQLDRGVVAILLQSIKAEMHLSDTALGLLTGFGFSLVYVVASIPIGRMADRYNRINMISIGMLLYSIVAMGMGFAANMTQLVLARSAVAIGEATGSGPSTSLIADLYPVRSRARAIGIWASGTYIGLFLGLSAGGWLNQHYGWRVALGAIAAPGVLVAVALKFTATEPTRGQSDGQDAVEQPKNTLIALQQLFANNAYLILLFAVMGSAFVNYTFSAWTPAVLARVDHFDAASIGLASGFFRGLLGLGGVLLGGFAAHLAGGRFRTMGMIAATSSLLIVPSMLMFLFAPSKTLSLVGLGLGNLLFAVCQAPGLTMVQGVVAPGNRSFSMTLVLSISTLFGLGVGPLVTGMISDATSARLGSQSLIYGLLVPTVMSLITAAFYVVAAYRAPAAAAGGGKASLRADQSSDAAVDNL
jgi:predicted MFS family arabinose efflux permease